MVSARLAFAPPGRLLRLARTFHLLSLPPKLGVHFGVFTQKKVGRFDKPQKEKTGRSYDDERRCASAVELLTL